MNRISQIQHDSVKNPKWPEVNQLVIYKGGRGVEFCPRETYPAAVQNASCALKLCARPARKNSHSFSKMENNELV